MQVWPLITSWIAEQSPGEHALIRPPADESQLRAVAEEVDRPLPPQLADWWCQADGIAGRVALIPPMYVPHSTAQALDRRASVLEHWNGVQRDTDPERFDAYIANAETQPAGSRAGAWLPSFLSIASSGGHELFADLRPGPMHGCLGEFYTHNGIEPDVVWNNVAHMLIEIWAGMRHGSRVRGYRIGVDEDGIYWR